MSSFNRVILLGNLTRDPQLKYLPSGTAVCEFGLATNHRWRDKDGNQKEEVCFVDVSAFGRQGETINQYMTKGRAILVEGRLKLDSWTAQDGTKRSKHSVIVDNFTFVGGRGDAPGGAPSASGGYNQDQSAPPQQAQPRRAAAAPPQQSAGPPEASYAPGPPDDDMPPPRTEDIPF